MKGLLIFDQLNDVVFVKLDKSLQDHLYNACLKEGLVQAETETLNSDASTSLNMNVLMQLFSPMLTSQRIMLGQFNNPYTAIHSKDGTIMTFAESLGFLFIAIGSETEENLAIVQRRLYIFVRLVKLVCGPVYNTLKSSCTGGQERQKIVVSLMDMWEEFRQKELSFLLEGLERLLVNHYVNMHCIQLLQTVLEKIANSGQEICASHAFILVNTKLLALFSSRNASELVASDMLALTLLAHTHHPSCRLELPRSPRRTPSQSTSSRSRGSSTVEIPNLSGSSLQVPRFSFSSDGEAPGSVSPSKFESSVSGGRLHAPIESGEESSDSEAFYSPCATPPQLKNLDQALAKLVLQTEEPANQTDFQNDADVPVLGDLGCSDYTQDYLFLHTSSCRLAPHIVHTVKVMEGVVLVIICDIGKSHLAGSVLQSLEILHMAQLCKQPDQAKQVIETLEADIKRLTEGAKKLKNPPINFERFPRSLQNKWDMVKKNSLGEFLRSTTARFMTSKLESSVTSLMDKLREGFNVLCFTDSSAYIPLSVEVINTLVDVQAGLRYGIADYADYLRVKSLRNVTITSYINEFPGLVHFIYVNRSTNQVIVPTMDDGLRLNNTNLTCMVKEKVIRMVEFIRSQLQLGHFSIVWRDTNFHYSYFLWFEDTKGESLKPEVLLHGLRNFPPPGVLSGDFYELLCRECFPGSAPGDIHCYELFCMHLATATPTFVVDHARRLAASIWDLCRGGSSPVELL